MQEEKPSRPEMPWALWAGLAGGTAVTALAWSAILKSTSSTAAIGYLFLPFVFIGGAVFFGIWGLAAGAVVAHLRGVKQAVRPVLIMAWVVVLAVPAALAWNVGYGLMLERAVRDARGMDAAALSESFEQGSFRHDKFYLGALAQHPAARGDLLARIAALPDPELHDGMGSLWDVMGENRKGIAVMRLVAKHPHADPATLKLLSGSPREDVAAEVLQNPNVPAEILQANLGSSKQLVQWALASNPKTPPAEMARLAKSEDRYVRMNLTWNTGTPVDILERLAKDADELVGINAQRALEKRRKGQ